MGCGNSSPATTTSHSNKDGSFSNEGRAETPTKVVDRSNDLPEDEKRLNYGGVYVGLPTDMSNIPQLQIGVLRETESDLASLMRPLWGNGS